mmetsp:Transcript_7295/g.10128  ORF Transcript_7295/g.10128 Transcript_7295/m.10128 type:complete len:311 (+) Transcript_7295:41-973(+)
MIDTQNDNNNSSQLRMEFYSGPGAKHGNQVCKGRVKRINFNMGEGSALKIENHDMIQQTESSKKLIKTDGALGKFEAITEEEWSKDESQYTLSIRVLAPNENHDITSCTVHSKEGNPGPITILTPNKTSFVKFAQQMFLLVRFNHCTPSSHKCDALLIEVTLRNEKTGETCLSEIEYHMKTCKSSPQPKKQKLDNYEIPPAIREDPRQWCKTCSWFFEDTDAMKAEQLLAGFENGTYLARSSATSNSAHCISFKKQDGVVHWRFQITNGCWKSGDGTVYNTMQSILDTYKSDLLCDAVSAFIELQNPINK